MLNSKEIILGVTGSIAAYKSIELLREFSRLKASITVIMTRNAKEFISPLSFQTLSKQNVHSDLFQSDKNFTPKHIALSHKADCLLVAPATANIIGKFASGIADDFLSTLFLSIKVPVIIAPAMNPAMYSHPMVKRNIRLLQEKGIEIVEPSEGEVACGECGQGRLAPIDIIVDRVIQRIVKKGALFNQNILITAGPTREYLDPIRYLSNKSSGKMGFALAKASHRRGAKVTLISGPTNLSPPGPDIKHIPVISAKEMLKAVEEHFYQSSIVIMAAAVCDFQPLQVVAQKINKRALPSASLKFTNSPDILTSLGQKKKNHILVGFAAETEKVIEKAQIKLEEKNLDLICANDVTKPGAGFASDTNIITLIDSSGEIEQIPLMSKDKAAEQILDKIERLLFK